MAKVDSDDNSTIDFEPYPRLQIRETLTRFSNPKTSSDWTSYFWNEIDLKPVHLFISLSLQVFNKYDFKITSKVCRWLRVSRIEPFDIVIEEPIPEVSKEHPFQLGVYGWLEDPRNKKIESLKMK